MLLKVVIDTNVIVSSLSSRSIFHWLIRMILEGVIELYVTDEILYEYEEIIAGKYSKSVAGNFMLVLKELPTVKDVHIYYRWN